MEDDNTSDSEQDTFHVEYTASELYALHGLLRYLSLEMDHSHAIVAQSLAKQTHDAMANDDFTNAMQREVDEFEEEMGQNPQGNMMGGNISDMGKVGFQ